MQEKFSFFSSSFPQSSNHLVHVALGPRSYDIHIGRGALEEFPRYSAKFSPKARLAVIADARVEALHGAVLKAQIAATGREIGRDALIFSVPPGESSKSFAVFERLSEALLEQRFERGDLILAFGGGVAGDLAGFVAATLLRGVDFIQIPTTLLAQVDSSVGGKTGINSRYGKNLVGAYHQPRVVLADLSFLETLPKRELRSGYAEIVKYGLIDDPEFFAFLEKRGEEVLRCGEICAEVVAHSCRAKARIVAADETEKGQRALLNLGHTFGHALEKITGYDSDWLLHGEGVAIGLVMAHHFSQFLGLCSAEVPARVEKHLASIGLPVRFKDIPGGLPSADALLAAMAQDKKVVQGALTFVLSRGIGKAFLQKSVPTEQVRCFLSEVLS